MKKNEVEQDAFYDEKNDELITEEELEHIHSDLDNNFHIQQWTQVSWQLIKMIQKTSLINQKILANTAAES